MERRSKSLISIASDIAEGFVAVNPLFLKTISRKRA